MRSRSSSRRHSRRRSGSARSFRSRSGSAPVMRSRSGTRALRFRRSGTPASRSRSGTRAPRRRRPRGKGSRPRGKGKGKGGRRHRSGSRRRSSSARRSRSVGSPRRSAPRRWRSPRRRSRSRRSRQWGRGRRGPSPKPDGCRTIWIGWFTNRPEEEEIIDFFRDCGGVTEVKITDHQVRGHFAHVQFEDTTCVDLAMRKQGTEFKGRRMELDYAYMDKVASNSRMQGSQPGLILRCKPKSQKPTNGHTLWLGDLSIDTTEQDVIDLFEPCGKLEMICLKVNKLRNGHFGHAKFVDTEAVDKAVELAGTLLKGVPLRMDYAEDKPVEAYRHGKDKPGPDTNSRPEDCRMVFVGGLPNEVTKEMVESLFEPCGEIREVRLDQSKRSGTHFCHIEFADGGGVDRAMKMSGERMGGAKIRVDFAENRRQGPGGGALQGWGGPPPPGWGAPPPPGWGGPPGMGPGMGPPGAGPPPGFGPPGAGPPPGFGPPGAGMPPGMGPPGMPPHMGAPPPGHWPMHPGMHPGMPPPGWPPPYGWRPGMPPPGMPGGPGMEGFPPGAHWHGPPPGFGGKGAGAPPAAKRSRSGGSYSSYSYSYSYTPSPERTAEAAKR